MNEQEFRKGLDTNPEDLAAPVFKSAADKLFIEPRQRHSMNDMESAIQKRIALTSIRTENPKPKEILVESCDSGWIVHVIPDNSDVVPGSLGRTPKRHALSTFNEVIEFLADLDIEPVDAINTEDHQP